jgi:hypothetical protein
LLKQASARLAAAALDGKSLDGAFRVMTAIVEGVDMRAARRKTLLHLCMKALDGCLIKISTGNPGLVCNDDHVKVGVI